MANPIWLTGQGERTVNLGTVTEGSYFEYPIDSYDPSGGPVTYKFLAGSLPPGIRINPAGFIQGGPYLNTIENKTTRYEFTVRAVDQHGLIADKTFVMTIANVNPPIIVPRISDLGEVFDGEFYSLQLAASELNPYAKLTWSLSSGSLPDGLTLDENGLISGFIIPLGVLGFGGNIGFNANPYNEFAYENSSSYQFTNYKFTAKVYDGTNYDSLTYQLKVSAKGQFSADNDINTIDDTYLSIDNNNVYSPIILTPSQALPEVRSNSKFAFKFDAIDPAGQPLSYGLSLSSSGAAGFDQGSVDNQFETFLGSGVWVFSGGGPAGSVPGLGFDTSAFDQQNLSVPPGIILDTATGWLSGTIGPQIESIKTYTFQIYAYETLHVDVQSDPITYTMTVLGDITNNITWTTSANLGIIDNGSISELSVSAINNAGHPLKYALIGEGSSLPQGLELQSSGLIAGRAGFEFFSLDRGATRIDGQISDFDNTHTFIVQATNVDGTASSQKTFTILINNFNLTPYENIYIKALPSFDQRKTFLDIVNNTDIFPESLIYRSSDPNFGRARDIRSLFLAGLKATEVSNYVAAMGTNTYNKRIEFGDVKTAIAVDENFNTKYEVVYVELKDDEIYKGKSPANSRFDTIINKTIYPNSFANMSSVILNETGYENPGVIPGWMSSPQANKKQLGFTRAIVLAYTVPGASNLIAYRLGASGIEFNKIDFVLDRYDLDNSYSVNFNIATDEFDLGKETTFDSIIRPTSIVTSATYGVRGLAFNMINNKTVTEINARGGFDGITNFSTDDTLVFLQQQDYPGETSQNDGWSNTGLIPGWVEFTNSASVPDGTSGFPTSPSIGQVALVNNVYYMFVANLDTNGNLIDTVWKVANLRANVWTINIDSNDVVTLTPKTFLRFVGNGTNRIQISSMIESGDYVQINKGVKHSQSIVYYNPTLSFGQSVPSYTEIQTLLSWANETTSFDGYGTRFINNRISYENPEIGDTWLKFPATGPLQ